MISAPRWSVYAVQMRNIEELSKASKDDLLNLWRKLPTRDKPPKAKKVLIAELSYRIQEQELGKLDKNTTVSLRRYMNSFEKTLTSGESQKSPKVHKKMILEVGSQIRKQWQGEELIVQVVGTRRYEYEGQTFKSLSAVAKAITGQHLSGPLFFNLKN